MGCTCPTASAELPNMAAAAEFYAIAEKKKIRPGSCRRRRRVAAKINVNLSAKLKIYFYSFETLFRKPQAIPLHYLSTHLKQ